MLDLLQVAIGASLVAFGRRLFWVFVAGVGFVVGLQLALRFLPGIEDWVSLGVALLAGLVGAILVSFLQRLAIGAAGFFAGWQIAMYLIDLLRIDLGNLDWVGGIVGGLIGIVLIALLFDWALIFLSSIVGAIAIVDVFELNSTMHLLLLVILALAGILIQFGWLRRRPERESVYED
ncbi:MAG: DUF4203 domain-containing protein [Anaerolineales bacterium]